VSNNVLGNKDFTSDSASSITVKEVSHDFVQKLKKGFGKCLFLTVYLWFNT
jgi:hypothetical protein